MRKFNNKFVAFSLVELMAAVAIVSILTTLALPRYRLFIATSRQAEAQANLGIIATLQQSYHLEYNTHHSSMIMGNGNTTNNCTNTGASKQNQLGFRSTKCEELRYTYTSSDSGDDLAENDGTHPLQSGHLIYPRCAGSTDTWKMSKDRELTNVAGGIIKQCHE